VLDLRELQAIGVAHEQRVVWAARVGVRHANATVATHGSAAVLALSGIVVRSRAVTDDRDIAATHLECVWRAVDGNTEPCRSAQRTIRVTVRAGRVATRPVDA